VFVAVETSYGGATPGQIAVVPAGSAEAPHTLVSEQREPSNLVYDERFGLLYTDIDQGSVLLVPAASLSTAEAVEPKAVIANTTPQSIALDGKYLYVAIDPGKTNETKGSIRRFRLSVIPTD